MMSMYNETEIVIMAMVQQLDTRKHACKRVYDHVMAQLATQY